MVLTNEAEIKGLRRDLEGFRQEHDQQHTIITTNQQVLSNKIDSVKDSVGFMQNIFTWGFAAVAIGVAVAPMIKSWFESRKNTSIAEEVSRQIDAKLRELNREISR